MAGVFSSQVVTVAGRTLIASATATNQIVFVKALSATTVPADPSQTSGYDGVQGTITSSSATNNVARVVTSYNNARTNAPQPVKAIALMGKLASQSDAEAVIFAYCTDSGSEIHFPAKNAPEQITRFAYNIAFEGNAQAPLEVTEAGAASLSDLDRFVSLHRAGDPTTGEVQVIRGRKTFTNEITLQSTLSSSSLIKTTGAVSGSTGIFQEAYLKTPNEVKQVYAYTNESISRVQFKTVPVAISSESNAEIAVTGTFNISATGGINVDGRLLPVQEYSYLGDSDHVWFYAHINELTAEEVSAGVLSGANPTISEASVSVIPESEVVPNVYDGDVVTIPIGGLILVVPNATWMQNGGVGRKIMPGESIIITNANKDAFMVADWTVGDSGSGYSPKIMSANEHAFLKVGTYRALSYITYPSGSQHPTGGAPILLQRVACCCRG